MSANKAIDAMARTKLVCDGANGNTRQVTNKRTNKRSLPVNDVSDDSCSDYSDTPANIYDKPVNPATTINVNSSSNNPMFAAPTHMESIARIRELERLLSEKEAEVNALKEEALTRAQPTAASNQQNHQFDKALEEASRKFMPDKWWREMIMNPNGHTLMNFTKTNFYKKKAGQRQCSDPSCTMNCQMFCLQCFALTFPNLPMLCNNVATGKGETRECYANHIKWMQVNAERVANENVFWFKEKRERAEK